MSKSVVSYLKIPLFQSENDCWSMKMTNANRQPRPGCEWQFIPLQVPWTKSDEVWPVHNSCCSQMGLEGEGPPSVLCHWALLLHVVQALLSTLFLFSSEPDWGKKRLLGPEQFKANIFPCLLVLLFLLVAVFMFR